MGKNVLIVAEQRGGVLKKVALELLGVGAKLAAPGADKPHGPDEVGGGKCEVSKKWKSENEYN